MHTPAPRGFTLIELLIVLTLVAILAAVAYPSYTASVANSRRGDAKAALNAAQLAQEKFRANCPNYAGSMGATMRCDVGLGLYTMPFSPSSPQGHYQLSFVGVPTATSYTLTAIPQGGQAADSCGSFAIDQDGPITTNPSYAGSDCWRR